MAADEVRAGWRGQSTGLEGSDEEGGLLLEVQWETTGMFWARQ